MRREALIATLNGSNVVATFATQLLIYRAFGASHDTDVYFATAAIPQLLSMVLATTASGVLVPMLAKMGLVEQDRDTWTFLIVIASVAFLGSVVLIALAPWLAPLLWPGFRGPQGELALTLIQIQLASSPFIAATVVLTAIRHARNQFAQTEFLNLGLSCAVAMALVVALPRHGVESAVWLMAARYVLQTLILGCFVRPTRPDFRSPGILEAWQRSRVLLAGNAFFKTDVLVDRHLLSQGAVGSLSLFTMAQSMLGAVAGMIGQAWGNAAVPRLAVLSGAGNKPAFVELLRTNELRIFAVASVLLIACCALAQPLITAITGRALVTREGDDLWLLLLLMAGVPIFGALGSLISGSFYALGDTKTPTYVSTITFTAFVILKVILFKSFGMIPFCLLTSAYYAANALLLRAALLRRIDKSFAP